MWSTRWTDRDCWDYGFHCGDLQYSSIWINFGRLISFGLLCFHFDFWGKTNFHSNNFIISQGTLYTVLLPARVYCLLSFLQWTEKFTDISSVGFFFKIRLVYLKNLSIKSKSYILRQFVITILKNESGIIVKILKTESQN